jgi:Zn-dependent protease with chaperone function
MGPFFSSILAAFLADHAVSAARYELPPEGLQGTVAVLGALGCVAAGFVLGRVGGMRRVQAGLPTTHVGGFERLFDLVAFLGLLRLAKWGVFVREAVPFEILDGPVAFIPYLAAAMARVVGALGAEPKAETRDALSGVVAIQARLSIAAVSPIFFFTALRAGFATWPEFEAASLVYRQTEVLVSIGGLAIVVVFIPAWFRALFRARPLDDPELKADCEAFARRANFPLDFVGTVTTRRSVVNAVYVGLIRPFRTVLFTDGLLARLDRGQRLAVFAHEVGHGAKRHLFFFAAGLVALSAGLPAFFDDVAAAARGAGAALASVFGAGASEPTEAVILFAYGVGAPIAGLVLLMGFVSRRFETEADFFAAETTGDTEAFVAALEGVAAAAGPAALRDGFRHFGVPKRVALLREVARDPAARAKWARTFRRIRVVILLAAAAALARLLIPLQSDFEEGRFRYLTVLARLVDEERRPAAAEAALDACRAELQRPETKADAAAQAVAVLFALFDDAMRKGEYDEARRLRDAWTNDWPSGDAIGDFNRIHAEAQLAALTDDVAAIRKTARADLDALAKLEAAVAAGEIGVDARSFVETSREIRLLATLAEIEPPSPAATTTPAGRVFAALVDADRGFSAAGARDAFAALQDEIAWRKDALTKAVRRRFGSDVESALRTKFGEAFKAAGR